MYDYGAGIEYERLAKNPINEAEFELTTDLIKKYVEPNSLVADIGSGSGRYSEYLIKKLNCKVGLVDISEVELQHFKNRIEKKLMKNIEFIEQDSATNLVWISDNFFDNILLMGPMYHLVSKHERIKVLENCQRIMKLNAVLIISYISPYANLINVLKNNAVATKNLNSVDSLLTTGEYILEKADYKMQQFRCFPSTAIEELNECGFEIVKVRNLEGVGSFISDMEMKALTEDSNLKLQWFDFLKKTSEIPDLLGATRHFSCVVKKEKRYLPQRL